MTTKILARANVEEFDRFWEIFRSRGAKHRKEFGSEGSEVMRNHQDANEVWVLFDWDPERYGEFLQDETAREIMKAAGLKGPPQAIVLDDLGHVDS